MTRLIRGKSGYRIKIVPVIKSPKSGNYLGMNNEAAKSQPIRMPYPYGKNTILIKEGLTKEQQERFAVHEAVEKTLMDDNGVNWGYGKSHKVSNILEHNPNILIKVRGSAHSRGTVRQL